MIQIKNKTELKEYVAWLKRRIDLLEVKCCIASSKSIKIFKKS